MIQDYQLFGQDPTENIVAVSSVETDEPGEHVMVWKREGDEVTETTERVWPFLFIDSLNTLGGFHQDNYRYCKLEGGGYYQYLLYFETWDAYYGAINHVKQLTGADSPIQIYNVWSKEQQYLMQTGRTLFKGMSTSDPVHLHFDIEVYSSTGAFPQAKRKGDHVFIVVASDNRGNEWVLHTCMEAPAREGWLYCVDEETLLRRFVSLVKQVDPDVIVGHNVYGFDLPYVADRLARYDIPFDIGRDGSEPRRRTTSKRFAERLITYEVFEIAGRHVYDTYFSVMSYDVFKRSMQGYDLKSSAREFGLAREGRVYVPGDQIAQTWDTDPMKILEYAIDDVRETAGLMEALSGSDFYLTQMVPMTFQNVQRLGPASKIESLFVREYLRQKRSLAKPEEGKQKHGGYTDIFMTGVVGPVLYADVESLYPAIMLNYGIQPESERLRLFPEFLSRLTDLRFEAKNQMRLFEKGSREHQEADARQSSYKIVINSFYGSIGSKYFIFNDYSEADRVATTGQSTISRIKEVIENDGGRVIELDTDGALFVPPPFVYVEGEEYPIAGAKAESYQGPGIYEHWESGKLLYVSGADPKTVTVRNAVRDEDYVLSLSEHTDEGINIGFDGRFKTMLSYKKKNYALVEYGGKIKYKGSSFKARSMEPFAKNFLKKGIMALAQRDVEALRREWVEAYTSLMERKLTPESFCKTETLKDAIDTYIDKVEKGVGNGGRNRSAPYELALQIQERTGQKPKQGDRITYYVSGEKKSGPAFEKAKLLEDFDPDNRDENVKHYLGRLKTASKKFSPFFSAEDFKIVFSEPDGTPVDLTNVQLISTNL